MEKKLLEKVNDSYKINSDSDAAELTITPEEAAYLLMEI